MTNDSISKLQDAAQNGDIDLLYTVIHEDQFVLEHIDVIPFVDTPLHIAAAAGHLHFASEIIRLKPSFAWKLNQQGFSPIHLALQQGRKRMVQRLVDINKDLVLVKGREGLTPLHFVCQTGDIDLLAEFLLACPDSIEVVTVKRETALHIAMRHNQYEALEVLVGWLKRILYEGAMHLENTILNWKDEEGNTILHISALRNDSRAVRLLIKSKIDSKARNLENLTALDIATSEEIENMIKHDGALRGSSVSDLSDKLRSNITGIQELVIWILRIRGNMSEDKRNALLVVATLVAAATYQAALSPPGGVYQVDGGDNNLKNSNASFHWLRGDTKGNTGRSVMTGDIFLLLWILNMVSFLASTGIIILLTPSGIVGALMLWPVLYFAVSYFSIMMVISPSPLVKIVAAISSFIFIILAIYAYFFRLVWKKENQRKMLSGIA